MRDIDYVFNPAAVTSPPEFEDIDGKGYEINIMGTYNILKAAYKIVFWFFCPSLTNLNTSLVRLGIYL